MLRKVCSKAFVSKSLFGLVRRFFSIQEHTSMGILRKSGVSVPKGQVASSAQEALEASKNLGCRDFVVKAQVLSGGRGKGHFEKGLQSGVQIAFSPQEVEEIAKGMIGDRLITKQTGEEGLPCNKVYICERLFSRREYYICFILDRNTIGPLLIGSNRGGMNIEEVANKNPDLIHKLPININKGLSFEEAETFLRKLEFEEASITSAAEELVKLYHAFSKNECTLLEINPLSETIDGKVVSMDCKIQLDDNAAFRHPEYKDYRDYSQENPLDVIAAQHDINYIRLDGTIGCLVNGAGLAMATMDIITLYGGRPANFLDIGGGATIEQVTTAFNLIKSDPKVKAILVNIFGGIMRCDIIAEGIIEAAKTLHINIPLVVRLQGTKVEEAHALFATSQLKILAVSDLDAAAKMVVKLADIMELAHEIDVKVQFELPI